MFKSRAGRHPGQGEFLAGQAHRRGLELKNGVVSPGGAALVGVDAVFEFGPQAVGHFAELLGAGLDGVGQAAGQVGQGVDLRVALAEHITHGAVAGVLAVDVGFEAGLVGVELALQGRGVEVLQGRYLNTSSKDGIRTKKEIDRTVIQYQKSHFFLFLE